MSTTVITTIRIPKDLHAELAKLAKSDDRSLNTLMIRSLRDAVDRAR